VAPAEVDGDRRAAPGVGDKRRGGPARDPVLGAGRGCDSSTGWRPPPFAGRRTTSSALPSVTPRVTITAG